jgi:hypothetical protein
MPGHKSARYTEKGSNMNSTIKSNIVGTATMVPALILSQKIVKEVGWKKSIFPRHYLPVMRQHPVLSTIYYVGLSVQIFYTIKQVVEVVREAKAEEYMASSIEEAVQMSIDEAHRNARMAKYEEHARLAKESATTQRIEVKVPVDLVELHAALLEQVRQAYVEATTRRDAGGEYDAAQGYLADIRGTLWVSEGSEPEISQINSTIRMLTQMKDNDDNVVSDWGVAKAEEILSELGGFAIKDMQL